MRDAIDRVLAYAEPGRQTFMDEPMRQDAIIRNLETAGEAAHLLVLIERSQS